MRRVLLITYYWPPAGGAPVQRVLKWARYLPEFGWLPHVLTVERGAYSSRDPQLAEQVPESVRVTRTRSLDPFVLYARLTGQSTGEAVTLGFASDRGSDWRESVSRWVRANLFIPDARAGWIPFARRAGLKLMRTMEFDAILSSGPPHSVHLAARALRRKTGVPWVADFRDPWTEAHYLWQLPQTSWSKRSNAYLERQVLRTADAVVTVSPTLKTLFEERFRGTPVSLVYNGFDEEDFRDVPEADTDTFWITYAGSMNPEQNPEVLWEVLGDLMATGTVPKLRLRFLGRPDASVRHSIRGAGLEPITEFQGQLSHAIVAQRLAASAVLLVVVNRIDSAVQAGILPTKLFEYLGVGRPVLAIGPTSSDLKSVLESTMAGELIHYDDRTSLRDFIGRWYAAWSQSPGRNLVGLPEVVGAFSRREGTRSLSHLLDQVAADRSRNGAYVTGK